MTLMRLFALLLGLVWCIGSAHAAEERRVALIIGNAAYRNLPKLSNAANDSRAMAAELKAAGFETTVKINAGRREMLAAINEFSGRLSAGAVGLFYYAGHGIQAKDRNFLIPVDAQMDTEDDLEADGVEAGKVLRGMEEAHNRLNIVVLDACRDNPLPKGRSAGRGLAVMPAPTGTFVAYATGPGQIAQDGDKGANGVFTGELVKALRQPGLSIEQVFKAAAGGVRERTGGKQVPWIQASIQGDFYFRPPSAVAPAVRNDGGGSGGTDKETVFWQSIQGSTDPAMYEAYLGQWPSGTFAAIAKAKVESLKGTKTASLSPGAVRKPEPVLEALDREMVAGRKASVRESPEAKAKLISTLSEGDSIQVTGKVKGENWYAVSRKGQTVGYVVSDTLEEPSAYKSRKDKEAQAAAEEAKRRQQVAVLAPPPSTLGGGGSRSPGAVFRDCPDCPEMVVIPAGSFTMGSDAVEQDWYVAQGGDRGIAGRESPQHRVTIGRSFAVGKYAVTQAEWEAVMGSNPSKFRGSRNPVEQVSWNDAQDFVNRLNAKVRSVVQVSTGGNGPYRLLTEAEWEYVARAGTTTKFPWGDSIGSGNANCDGCGSQWDNKTTAPVGSFRPNAFGLYDMHGNVWQWVQDCFVDSYAGAPSDGSALTGQNSCNRVIRGGSWFSNPGILRSAYRINNAPVFRFDLLGFRLARTL